jgi:hypothetical protein
MNGPLNVTRFWPDPTPYGENGIVPVSLPRVDQCQENFNAAVSPWLGYDCAQIFTAGISGVLRRVELNLAVSDPDGAARVAIWNASDGLPSQELEDFLALTEQVRPLSDGWNIFYPPRDLISITAGRQYALILETTSLCDWRVRVEGRLSRSGSLCQCFGTRGWEAMWPLATAAFRTYM